jgi:Methyltransferase domain/Glycosyl transferase family 2
MPALRNIFACLVHESPECVIDLVRNLHALDPPSVILLYNGGTNQQLLNGEFRYEKYGAVVHPSPRPMVWGHLHNFALDCMQFALQELPFDTLTIVDSDQLAARPGYSRFLAPLMDERKGVGLFGSSAAVQLPASAIGPAQTAFREVELWRPYLRRFPGGEDKFVHWSFWPSTVFTADAARDLIELFVSDNELKQIMSRTAIWATEEVILPTLVSLLGYEIAVSPCSYDYVRYRIPYTPAQMDVATSQPDVYWVHPVPRKYDDPLRQRIRERFNHYPVPFEGGHPLRESRPKGSTDLVLSVPILKAMKKIEGWLDEEEADLLIATCSRALSSLPADCAVVEVGSFCGRSTVVLGSVVRSLGASSRVYAIDPHDGIVGAEGAGLRSFGPTLGTFQRNLAANALTDLVEVICKRSVEVAWDKPIGFLFIDHLHDYSNIARDFHHFEPWVCEGGHIAFHDYADYYPGVKILVDEILALPQFERVHCAGGMMVIRKTSSTSIPVAEVRVSPKPETRPLPAAPAVANAEVVSAPLVSCIMPTADRRGLIPQAIRHFLRQDYPNLELIIVDDGGDSVADLVPGNDRIRYVRLGQRLSMGAKHNMACDMARGEIIAHWDDDDWIASWRVSYQVRELQQHSPDTLCGLSQVLFYDPRSNRAWQYLYPHSARPWVLGATFCYYKRFHEKHRFADMNEGADTVFVWNLPGSTVLAHQDYRFYVGTVHSRNTSPKQTETSGWQPLPPQDIRILLDDQDWRFYEMFGSQESLKL